MADSYASIFGVEAPQFEVSSTVVELDYVKVIKDEPDLDDIVHRSIKNGHKEWTRRGKHWVFEVIVNLTKYGSGAYDKYQELKSYKFTLVDKLWKRRDGDPIQNDDEEDVKFFIESIREFYFDHYLYPDRLQIRFVSQDPIDLVVSSGSAPYSAEALIYFDQFDVLPDSAMLDKLAEFIDGLVADGIYAKIDEMWLFAMNTEANALKGIKGYKACSKVGSPTFTALRGFKTASASNYLTTNFNPSADAVTMTSTSVSLGLYSRDDVDTPNSNYYEMGAYNIGSRYFLLEPRNSGSIRSLPNGTGSAVAQVVSSSLGLFIGKRTGGNINLYSSINGQSSNTGNASATLLNGDLYILKANNRTGISGREISFAFVGSYLDGTESASLDSRLETLLDYIGAGVM